MSLPLLTVADHGRELGTSYELEVVVPVLRATEARLALAAARAECQALERVLSEWREDSEISRLNREAFARPVEVSPLVSRLLGGALHVAQATSGAFDFTWAPLGLLWEAAAAHGQVPEDRALALARDELGFRRVSVRGDFVRFARPGTRLGVASFAKGWIIDALFLLLRRRGFRNVIVNIGGDLRVSGVAADGAPQVFKVLDPYRPSHIAAQLAVADGAIATSGNYFRKRTIGGADYGHLFDPVTGFPPTFDGSVTVLAADATMADALSTALFVMGPEKGLGYARRLPGLEVLYLTRQGAMATEGLARRGRFVKELAA